MNAPVSHKAPDVRRFGAACATRATFLVAGFGLACWAPLIPLVKARLEINDATLGLLLLCLGLGSVVAMQVAGVAAARVGSKPVTLVGGAGMIAMLPVLPHAPGMVELGAALALFGAFLGSIEVGMNVHAVEVEKASGRPLMSGFHALFSVGGFAGSSFMTIGLSYGLGPGSGTGLAALMMLGALLFAAPRLLTTGGGERTPLVVLPRGIVVLLAVLAAILFLVEGAILDWGALWLTSSGMTGPAQGGLGYAVFAVAMTAGRLGGDAIVRRLGDRAVALWGGLLAIFGFLVLLAAPMLAVALAGFLLIGLGASNIVPVLFRAAGAQTAMPASLAVAAVTTVGYAGILVGPAAIGFVAQATSLAVAFGLLAAMLCVVPLSAHLVARNGK